MVGQRTLTPLILVRIQVKQPIKKRPVAGVFLLAEKPLLNGEGSDSNRAVVIKTLTEAQLLSDAVAKLTKQEPERPVAGVFLLAEKPLLNGEGSDSNRAVVIKTLTEAQLLSDAVAKLTKQEPERPVAGVFLLAEKPLLNDEDRGSNRACAAFCSGIFPARRSAGEV